MAIAERAEEGIALRDDARRKPVLSPDSQKNIVPNAELSSES